MLSTTTRFLAIIKRSYITLVRVLRPARPSYKFKPCLGHYSGRGRIDCRHNIGAFNTPAYELTHARGLFVVSQSSRRDAEGPPNCPHKLTKTADPLGRRQSRLGQL